MNNNIFPNAKEILLIKAVLYPSEFEEYWSRWKAKVNDYQDLDDSSLSLFPLLYKSIKKLPTDSFRKPIENSYKLFWLKNNILINQVSKDLETFKKANLPFMILKGGALIPLYYNGDFGLRNLEDIDVFVSRESFYEAIHSLNRAGWKVEEWQNLKTFDTDFYHSISLYKESFKIDLHCHILSTYLKNDDWVLFSGEAQTFKFGDKKFKTISPSDHLVHSCVHGMHFNSSGRFRWIIDSARIINSGNVDWERVYLMSVKTESTIKVYEALKYLKIKFKLNIPSHVLNKLKKTRTTLKQRRMYLIGLDDMNVNFIQSLEYYFWIFTNSVEKKSIVRRTEKFVAFIKYLTQSEKLSDIPAAVMKKTSKLIYRSFKFN